MVLHFFLNIFSGKLYLVTWTQGRHHYAYRPLLHVGQLRLVTSIETEMEIFGFQSDLLIYICFVSRKLGSEVIVTFGLNTPSKNDFKISYCKLFFRCNKTCQKHGSHFQTCPNLWRKFSIHDEADEWSAILGWKLPRICCFVVSYATLCWATMI